MAAGPASFRSKLNSRARPDGPAAILDRGSKLQKEQQKRRDAAKLRIQRERQAKEAAARDQARVEAQIKARKLEQRRKEEEVGQVAPRAR